MITDSERPSEAPRQGSLKIIGLALLTTLVAGNGYFAFRANTLESELQQLRTKTQADIARLESVGKDTAASQLRTASDLQKIIETTEAKSQQAAVQAGLNARRYSDQLARKIATDHSQELTNTTEKLQQSSESAHKQILAQIGEVKQATSQTTTQISGIASEVSSVKTAVASTRSEVDRILAEMKSVRGDLGVQSGLIATNARELAALRALGERDYYEFQLAKTKAPQRVGDVGVLLKKSDTKRNRFTIEVVANDKKVEKKDRTINEPVQFYMARARAPYELVVNEVKRDTIVGYLSAPKVREAAARKQ